jgi:hypothetical protein
MFDARDSFLLIGDLSHWIDFNEEFGEIDFFL